jgi:hypothetical protein
MDGHLLSCLFLHSNSFKPLGLLRTVVILECCQIVVPSTRLFLNIDLSRTCRNQVACVVMLENLQRTKVLGFDSKLPIPHVWPVGVVSRLVMYRTKVLMYHTMVLFACLTKVRR